MYISQYFMNIIAFILLQFSVIQQQVYNNLNAFQSSEGIQHGMLAASIHRLSDNKVFLNFNEEKAVNSASTLKLITTATAISMNGANFRYSTDLLYSGQVLSGVLKGNLIIQGNGDPSFGSERSPNYYSRVLDEIVGVLRSLQVDKIDGNIIINDNSIFDFDAPDSWIWGDMGNYYGAIPHKFNVNENYYTVYFEPGNTVGSDASINSLQPFDEDWKIINLVKTGDGTSGDQVYIYGSPASETLVLKGTVPLGKSNFPVKGSIPNPAKLFRSQLIKALKNLNISVSNEAITTLPTNFSNAGEGNHLIKRFYSESLEYLARDCNFSSINMYADAFLHTLNIDENGFSTFNQGLETLKNHWIAKSIDLSGFNPKDGSGLSPSGYITPKNMVDILVRISKETQFESFYSTIPVLGEEGSVRYKDPKNKTGGRVRAKSGSIEGTRAFAGYFTDKKGEQYAFMIAINQYEPDASSKVRAFLDGFLVDIGTY
jgi:D-alanyl-D-alanine carboxypeptidase/D-alanyl-D-alanine-endopeptidase (penicillin-binding protein 4)